MSYRIVVRNFFLPSFLGNKEYPGALFLADITSKNNKLA